MAFGKKNKLWPFFFIGLVLVLGFALRSSPALALVSSYYQANYYSQGYYQGYYQANYYSQGYYQADYYAQGTYGSIPDAPTLNSVDN